MPAQVGPKIRSLSVARATKLLDSLSDLISVHSPHLKPILYDLRIFRSILYDSCKGAAHQAVQDRKADD